MIGIRKKEKAIRNDGKERTRTIMYDNDDLNRNPYENTNSDQNSTENTDSDIVDTDGSTTSGESGTYNHYNVNNFENRAQSFNSNQSEQNPNGQYSYNYYDRNPYGQEGTKRKKEKRPKVHKSVKKPKQPWGLGKKFGVGVVMAAVIGLVGGTTFYGVNYVGNRYIYNTTTSAAIAKTSSSSTSDFQENVQEVMDSSDSTVSTTSTSTDETVAQVAENCMPSLVTIATISVQEMQSFFGGNQQYEVEGAATGVIVGENDTELLIATNYHVVENATSLSVGFVDESTAEALVKGTDADNDLAVVSVKLSDISDDTKSQIKTATIGDSTELSLGDQVVAIGNALGYGQSVTSGYVSALDRSVTATYNSGESITSSGLIQTDAAINGGNSGGALLNMKGELIGINEAKAGSSSSSTTVEGMGYAIPISKALPILQELMNLPTREKVDSENTGYLGISCANVTSDIAQSYNMPEGICVTEVIEGGPAEAAGILKGDVITKIDSYDISTYDDLKEQLQYYAAGTTVTLTVMRANSGTYEEMQIDVTLTSSEIIENYSSNSSDSSNSNENGQSDSRTYGNSDNSYSDDYFGFGQN